MQEKLSELIKQAEQCLMNLGLSPDTIRDYRYSAFNLSERRMKDQENINAKTLLLQEDLISYLPNCYVCAELNPINTPGNSS